MEKKKNFIVFILIFACTIMAYVDSVLVPDYYVKSIIKGFLFLVLPFSYFIINKDSSIKSLFVFEKRQIKFLLMLGLIIFTIIVGTYFFLGSYFDLSNITKALESDIGVNKNNFIFVAMYIAIVNSFLEEFFFRGFAYLQLSKVSKNSFAMVVSSLFFAFYHIAMMINWFNVWLLLLITASLFIGGVIFNYINKKYNNIYASWVVHMFANIGINFIGFILFEII